MKTQMNFVAIILGLALIGNAAIAQMPSPAEPSKPKMILDDQNQQSQDIAQYRGSVLVLLYGDRKGMPANKELGEKLHVNYHPTAKGLVPVESNKAPAKLVPGLATNMRAPDVRVVPVACIGRVPELVKTIIRNRVKLEAPDTVVMLDFEEKMKEVFGMTEGEPNLVVIDAEGRLRMKMAGELDKASYTKLLQGIDYLRKEGAK